MHRDKTPLVALGSLTERRNPRRCGDKLTLNEPRWLCQPNNRASQQENTRKTSQDSQETKKSFLIVSLGCGIPWRVTLAPRMTRKPRRRLSFRRVESRLGSRSRRRFLASSLSRCAQSSFVRTFCGEEEHRAGEKFCQVGDVRGCNWRETGGEGSQATGL